MSIAEEVRKNLRKSAASLHDAKRLAEAKARSSIAAELARRREMGIDMGVERLAALGAFVPYLLLNVSSRTVDALLVFHTVQAMVLLGTQVGVFPLHQQKAFLEFFEAIGIDGRMLHDTGSMPVGISEATGEILLRDSAYDDWLKRGKAKQRREPLSSTFVASLLTRVQLDDAISALINLAAAGQEPAIVFSLLYLLSAISRRFASHPLDVKEIGQMLEAVIAQAPSTLTSRRSNSPGGGNATSPATLHQRTSIFVSSEIMQRAFRENRHAVRTIAATELSIRFNTIVALLLPFLNFMPTAFVSATEATALVALITHPTLKRGDAQVAALTLLTVYDLGLDEELLRVFDQYLDLYALGNEPKLRSARDSMAQHCERKLQRPSEAGWEYIRHLRKFPDAHGIIVRLELLAQSLPKSIRAGQERPLQATPDELTAAEHVRHLVGSKDEQLLHAIVLLHRLEGIELSTVPTTRRSSSNGSRASSTASQRRRSSEAGAHGTSQAGAHGTSQAGAHGTSQAGAHGTSQAGAHGTSQAGARRLSSEARAEARRLSSEARAHGTSQAGAHGTSQAEAHATPQAEARRLSSEAGAHGGQILGRTSSGKLWPLRPPRRRTSSAGAEARSVSSLIPQTRVASRVASDDLDELTNNFGAMRIASDGVHGLTEGLGAMKLNAE